MATKAAIILVFASCLFRWGLCQSSLCQQVCISPGSSQCDRLTIFSCPESVPKLTLAQKIGKERVHATAGSCSGPTTCPDVSCNAVAGVNYGGKHHPFPPPISTTSARCKTSYAAERLGSNIILPEKLQSSKPHVVYWCAGTLKLLDVNMFGWPAHTGRPAVATAADCCYACADTPGCNVSAAAAGLQTALLPAESRLASGDVFLRRMK